jgi:archaellum component FlaC
MNESSHNSNIKKDDIKDLLQTLSEKIDSLEKKIDYLTSRLDEEVIAECKKMGSHINFVEAVYENVKTPLGYICTKFNYFMENVVEQYTLTDAKCEKG